MMKTYILSESRKRGWASAMTAPPKIAARIAEIRRAILAGKPIPEPSAEYRSYRETASRVMKDLFPTKKTPTTEDAHLETLRRSLDVLRIF